VLCSGSRVGCEEHTTVRDGLHATRVPPQNAKGDRSAEKLTR